MSLAEPKEARISYRGTPEQRKRLKKIAVERETSVQKILDEAVGSYLTEKSRRSFSAATSTTSGSQPTESYTSSGESVRTAENERYHEMLDRILNAGGTYRTAIIANLEGWSRAVQLEDRSTEQSTGNPEEKQDGAAGAIADVDSAIKRAKESGEAAVRDEVPPLKRTAKRRASGGRNSQR